MREGHSQNITQVAQGDESRQTSRSSTLSKDVAEEETSHDNFGLGKIRLGNGCKVCDVGQDVKNRDTADGNGGGDGERLPGMLQLADNIVGVLPALVAVDDVQQGIRVGVCSSSSVTVSLFDSKGVVKVVRVWHTTVTSKSCKSGKDNEQQDDNLEHAQDVEKSNSPLW